MKHIKPLKRKTVLKPQSQDYRDRQNEWGRVTQRRAKDVNWHCERCDAFSAYLHGHHILKRSHGRDDSIDNCMVLCWKCHKWTEDEPNEYNEFMEGYKR